MSKYNQIGGLRLKCSGRVTRATLLEKMKVALESLTDDFELESFSGVNLYLQMYDKNGDRLALISSDGQVASGMDVKNIDDEFSWKEIGCQVYPVKEIERVANEKEERRRIEREKREAAYQQEYMAKQKKAEQEKQELSQIRKM